MASKRNRCRKTDLYSRYPSQYQKDDGDGSVKYQFSNAPPDTDVERFARDVM